MLGKLGRRSNDPAFRRRAIAARITLLSAPTHSALPDSPQDTAQPTPVISDAVILPETPPTPSLPADDPPKNRAPKVPEIKQKSIIAAVALEDAASLFAAMSFPQADEKQPKMANETMPTAPEKDDALLQLTDQPAPQDDLSVLQDESAPQIAPRPYSHSDSKVLNVAIDPEPQAGTQGKEEEPVIAEPPAKKKKARGKPSISFDLSALSEMGDETPPQSPDEAPSTDLADTPISEPTLEAEAPVNAENTNLSDQAEIPDAGAKRD